MTALSMARVAEALGAAGETIEAIQTLALLAVAAVKAGLAEAGPADVEAAATVGTVAGLEAVWAVAADGALLTTAVSRVARCAVAQPRLAVAAASVVAPALPLTAGAEAPFWAADGADGTHPSRRAHTGVGARGVADAPVLAGAGILTLESYSVIEARELAVWSSESLGAETSPRHPVTVGPVLAVATQQASGAVGTWGTEFLAQGTPVARWAEAGAVQGVAGATVQAFAGLLTVRPPEQAAAGAGTVGAPPSFLALAPIQSHTPPVDALSGTTRDTELSALIVALAAAIPHSIIHLYPLSVGCLVEDPLLSAGLGKGPHPITGLLEDLGEGLRI